MQVLRGDSPASVMLGGWAGRGQGTARPSPGFGVDPPAGHRGTEAAGVTPGSRVREGTCAARFHRETWGVRCHLASHPAGSPCDGPSRAECCQMPPPFLPGSTLVIKLKECSPKGEGRHAGEVAGPRSSSPKPRGPLAPPSSGSRLSRAKDPCHLGSDVSCGLVLGSGSPGNGLGRFRGSSGSFIPHR